MLVRFIRLHALLAVLTLLAVAGCATVGSPAQPDGGNGPGNDQFPVTIEHVFGRTTIESRPTKIITLGVTDADAVLALGTTPIAVTGYTFYPETGLGPWAEELIHGDRPLRLQSDAEPNLEQLAALEPDLIIGVSAGFEQDVYDRLSQIAPTIARPAEHAAYTVPMDAATRLIVTALGRSAEGDRLIEQAEQALSGAAADHPQFKGRTATVMLPFQGKYGAYTPTDARGRVMAQLGFRLPERLGALDDGKSYFIEVSPERLDLVDGDVLILLADQPADRSFTDKDKVLQALPVVRDGRTIIPDTDTRGAMTYNSVLSIPYAVERLVPELQRVLG
ncbi:iron-siderophore ABC transporter substrate-binding protein [Microlunatus parietis]